jgi:HAD superfamily hydrolase (TIGR01509 family)
MRSFDAVFFDFGGTLDADGIRWSLRFHAAYRAAGGTLGEASFEEVFRQSDRALAAAADIRGLGFSATARRQAEILARLLPDGARTDPAAMAAAFTTASMAIARRNRPLLGRLAERAPLAVISNYTGNLVPCLEELGLAGCFTVMLDSAVVGRQKPDPELFRSALREAGATAPRAWMVGDNPEADIRPALALGLRACWIAGTGRATPAGLEGASRITTLTDLEAVLG